MSGDVRDAPEVVVRNVLRSEWPARAANTEGVVPDVHHGWVNDGHDAPEVTISNPDESPIDGGDTGYRGFDPVTGKPTQGIAGTVDVNVWASRSRLDGVNPRKYAYLCKEVIRRIITENADAPTSEDIHRLAYLGARRFVDDEGDEVTFRYQTTIGYGYNVHPRTSP